VAGRERKRGSCQTRLGLVWRETGAVRNARPSRGRAASIRKRAQWGQEAQQAEDFATRIWKWPGSLACGVAARGVDGHPAKGPPPPSRSSASANRALFRSSAGIRSAGEEGGGRSRTSLRCGHDGCRLLQDWPRCGPGSATGLLQATHGYDG
jgi:hypothetical protein